MGWYYTTNASRADVVRQIAAPYGGEASPHRILRKAAVGNVLWTVEEVRRDGEPPRVWIGCYLLQRSGDGWGYKPLDEAMHPYYYSCPPAFLDLAPVACPEWREKVRARHAEKVAQRRRAAGLEVGATYALVGARGVSRFTVRSVRPLRGVAEDGREYRIPRRMIGDRIGRPAAPAGTLAAT